MFPVQENDLLSSLTYLAIMVTGGLVEELEEEEEEFQVFQEQPWLEVAAAMIFPCSLVASMNILLTLLVAMAACPD